MRWDEVLQVRRARAARSVAEGQALKKKGAQEQSSNPPSSPDDEDGSAGAGHPIELAAEGDAERGGVTGIKRDMEWAAVCREIACMNRPYART